MKKTILSLMLLLLFVAGAKAQNDTPLTFEAIGAGTVTLEKVGDFTPNSGVQYRMNETGDWLSYSYGTGISLQAGDKLQFRSTSSDAYAIDGERYSHFTCTADCYLYGSVGTLFNNASSLPGNACTRMFYGNTHIKNYPNKCLVLPAASASRACYEEMFSGCTSLTTAPELPATSLSTHCYARMFENCTALNMASILPATSLDNCCYEQMFSGCTSLTTAPKLPATSLDMYCYEQMFSGCTSLTTAPELPATSLAILCYEKMFSGCTSLTTAPELPATSLDQFCYDNMFSGCTQLNQVTCLATDISAIRCTEGWLSGVASTGTFFKAPEMEDWPTSSSGIPDYWTVYNYTMLTFEAIAAGTVTLEKVGDFTPNNGIQYRRGETGDWLGYSYGRGINLQAGDKLQFRSTSSDAYAIDPSNYSHFTCTADCYLYGSVGALFNNASSLPKNASSRMFYGNTHIKNHTDKRLVLPAASASKACYEEMFSGCTSLTTAPALPATSLDINCYASMFFGCSNLTSAPALPATSLDIGCYDGMFSGCTSLTTAPALPATSLAVGCYHNMFSGCTSLTTAPELPATTLVSGCYYQMFKGCTQLNYMTCLATDISASNCTTEWLSGVASTGTFEKNPAMTGWPSGDSGIPAGWTVEDYNNPMDYLTFQAVEAGTITVNLDAGATLEAIQYKLNNNAWTNVAWNTPIALSANDVIHFRGNNGTCYDETNQAGFRFACSNNCYVYGNLMSLIDKNNFATNTTLTQSRAFYRLFQPSEPNTPNTTLLNHPYYDVVLPATTLTSYCYCGLFANCQGITRAPVLPATTMQEGCYFEMFYECAALTTPPALPATTLAGYCYYNMFAGCTSLATAPTLPATTIASNCYYNMFSRCTNLTAAPELPATQLQDRCYSGMFNGCIKLKTAPALPATTLKNNCYEGMFNGCKLLKTAPVLPAPLLVTSCYSKMFYKCSKLNYVTCLATDITASQCVDQWLYNVANSGTFVKDPDMTSWTTGDSGIPNNWTVDEADIFMTEGNWNVAANWNNNAVPTTGSSVVIAANATIPSGYVADAKCVIVNEGKTLTIADGGELIHDNIVNVTLQKNITGYGNDNTVKTGWYTIASPVTGNINTSDVENLIASTATDYDLYLYNEPTHYWWNAKGTAHPFNTLQNGKGYLYANAEYQELAFTGPTQATDKTVTVPLSYAAEGDLKGYNLVGNPFTCNVAGNITLGGDALTSYYIADGTVNEGQNLIACNISERAIKPAEGFIVQATAVNQDLVFNPAAKSETSTKPAFICIEAGNDNFMDRAYVQFGGGNTLRKMSINDNTPKVYVMHDGKDYAAATIATATGELPVHFKAAENGTYTLTANIDNMEMSYLHLIDNMTGADVDLLTPPVCDHPITEGDVPLLRGQGGFNKPATYTFEAKTTDYESRFKLVFSVGGDANDDDEDAPFAFVNNGNIIVNGEGWLQVMDVMGRIVLSGDAINRVSTGGMAAGVYVLRLINGEDVKVQKIVIR